MPAQDSQLLLATRRGDSNAGRALWHQHAPRLIAYARSIVRASPHDADDIVQSAFCRIMQLDHDDLAAVRDTGAWLTQLTRRTALNWLRTLRRDVARRKHVAGEVASQQRGTTANSDSSLSAAIDALPARLREVVVLKHVAGLTFDQIEVATGINRSTAAARYRTALSVLRATLARASSQPSSSGVTTAATPQPRPRQGHVQHA